MTSNNTPTPQPYPPNQITGANRQTGRRRDQRPPLARGDLSSAPVNILLPPIFPPPRSTAVFSIQLPPGSGLGTADVRERGNGRGKDLADAANPAQPRGSALWYSSVEPRWGPANSDAHAHLHAAFRELNFRVENHLKERGRGGSSSSSGWQDYPTPSLRTRRIHGET
ncbi:hypothetical protein GJ744_005575 [Endocarpon pusillum]|uniref:Uncharacterized protein n=1 Tax=Endocarpon pusillum TaxID=364733 RepID=A0A8H7E5B0_9EURO|nr:hypothetical protein GJ744_005575 [Endocarpon pusillum]